MRTILVLGGYGFIGSAFVRMWSAAFPEDRVVVYDLMTYAGNPANLRGVGHLAVYGDIADRAAVMHTFERYAPDLVINFAAESHVDRSIADASRFISTNVMGTQVLLDAVRGHGAKRYLHVSTDEVYGTLGQWGSPFTEYTCLLPNSPYAASKAAADCLVRAAHVTHGTPALITRCSNNYGPRQFPEKLIPLAILKIMRGEKVPVYGDGLQVRDWVHVDDHCDALVRVLLHGYPGTVYNIGGDHETTNLSVVRTLLEVMGASEDLIEYVADRPGHDRRYAVDHTRITADLGWTPARTFDEGIAETVCWYMDNPDWVAAVRSGSYRDPKE